MVHFIFGREIDGASPGRLNAIVGPGNIVVEPPAV